MDYTKKPFYLTGEDMRWVEDTFSSMTLDEKLNQVLVDMLWNDPPKKVASQQKMLQLGGYRYNNMSAEKLWEQNNAIQKSSKIPALIAANIEAGGNGAVSGGTKLGRLLPVQLLATQIVLTIWDITAVRRRLQLAATGHLHQLLTLM